MHRSIGLSAAIGAQNMEKPKLLRQLTLTLNPNFFCTNSAPFSTGNKHTANGIVFNLHHVRGWHSVIKVRVGGGGGLRQRVIR